MNLATWAILSDEEQRRFIIEWCGNGGKRERIYAELAEKAAQSLEAELEGIYGITHVRAGAGEIIYSPPSGIPICRLVLYVCTSLREAAKIENLPDRFSGFAAQQLNLGDKRDAFLGTLKRFFKELKGWDEATTMNWVEHWGDRLIPDANLLIDSLEGGGLFTPVYSHGPVKNAIENGLLDESIREAVKAAGNDLIKLRNELLSVVSNAIQDAGSKEYCHPDKIENFDWKCVKAEMDRIIANYSCVKQPS